MDINKFISTLDAMFQDGTRSDEIEAYLTKSLMQAEAEADLAAEISVCNELCGFYRVQGKYDNGISVMQKALDNIKRLGLAGTSAHATALLNLATLLTHGNDVGSAVGYFSEAAEILKKDPSQGFTAAALHNNISSLYLRMNNISQGLCHTGKALALLAAMSDVGDETGVTYTIRAQLYLKSGDFSKAHTALRLAREAFQSDAGSSPVHMAVTEQCSAELLFSEGRYNEACEACERGIALLERSPVQCPAIDKLRERKTLCLLRLSEK